MNRRNWIVAALVAVPAVIGGGFAYANAQATPGFTCPVTGEILPCEKCCPLSETSAVAPAVTEPKAAADEGYTCPITGEKLGCPNCCPLNKAKK